MTVKDRTKEFRDLAEHQNKSKQVDRRLEPRVKSYSTPFGREAAIIQKGIYETTGKLTKLAKLAKKKTLFDDPAAEIQDLTYIIKKDITTLNHQIDTLETFVKRC